MKIILFIFIQFISGCNFIEKMSVIGEAPELTQIQNPHRLKNYLPVTMPMPMGSDVPRNRRSPSLWQTGAQAFFKDQRAGKVGDVVTVTVDINQTESINMTPTLQGQNQGSSSITNLFGLEKYQAVKGFSQKTNSNPNYSATGKYDVNDKINFRIAATIIQILPNGNMVVDGRQEVRLINEVREIMIKGIVRREDISASNTVNLDKIAELRISYGGRGDLTDLQSQPWGQQIVNKLSPF